jgi:hypothetical protein
MDELSVTVRSPGGVERRYRFAETPITIGRSPDCDIAILHEAVPRHLCRVWLEDGGRRVRAEERPGLTNALEQNGRAIEGGVSGERLALRIGPIDLALCPVGAGPAPDRGPGRRRALVALVAIAGGLLAAAWLFSLRGGAAGGAGVLASVPASVFDGLEPPRAPRPGDRSGRRERARLSESRGDELLARAGAAGRERVEAVRALREAAALYAAAADTAASKACALRAREAAEEIDRGWRRDRLALERGLAAGDEAEIARTAARLLDYLAPSQKAPFGTLSALAGPSRAHDRKAAR